MLIKTEIMVYIKLVLLKNDKTAKNRKKNIKKCSFLLQIYQTYIFQFLSNY